MEFCVNLMRTDIEPVGWARAREAEGWDVLAVADHLWGGSGSPFPHVWVTLTQMAMVTGRARLTSSFANNLFRSPVEFAQASLALQRASGGRFEAGLGAGWTRDEIVRTGRPFPDGPTRAGMYREAIVIAGELLRTGRCRFEGAYYRVDVPAIGPPCDPPPPLVAALGGPRTIREIAPLVDRVEIKAASSATRDGALDMATLAAVTADDVRRLVERVRNVQQSAPIGIFTLCAAGDGPEVERLESLLGDRLYGGFFGHPEKVAANMLRLAELGIERVQVSPMVPGSEEALAPFLARRVAAPVAG